MKLGPRSSLCLLTVVSFCNMATPTAFAKPSADQTARAVDGLLAEEVFTAETKLAPRVNDAIYLRRVWLDLVGDIPTPEHITAFVLDPAEDKRDRVVGELVDNPQFGQNWARYWRDVILLRRLEDRAAIVANPLVVALTERFNANEPWNKIAAEFITAKGDVRENGMTAVQMAQDGRTEETTAELSRIFLGIQIQCCQCHDHPYDSWKREQFHELAAFFPRIAVRPVQSPVRRSFEVVADDGPAGRRRNPNMEGRRGEPEHYMPDLDNPSAPGTRMKPRFFLTSQELPFGTRDVERRATAAEWMTENPWFATAFVNRMWAELVGEGFYEPVDDIGPERTSSAPKAVELLSRRFAESGHDVKWLFQVICATEAYQRESRPRRDVDGTPFVANVAQPLRSDQLYNALLTATDTDESAQSLDRNRRRGRPQMMGPYGQMATIRGQFEASFGYDPSDPRETVTSSIPQALAMMNGGRINLAARASDRNSVLGGLLIQIKEDRALVEELYLRTLSREPTDNELKIALELRESTNNRSAAFEDLFWALLNSSEFAHRR
jgi:hypothetical protein